MTTEQPISTPRRDMDEAVAKVNAFLEGTSHGNPLDLIERALILMGDAKLQVGFHTIVHQALVQAGVILPTDYMEDDKLILRGRWLGFDRGIKLPEDLALLQDEVERSSSYLDGYSISASLCLQILLKIKAKRAMPTRGG